MVIHSVSNEHEYCELLRRTVTRDFFYIYIYSECKVVILQGNRIGGGMVRALALACSSQDRINPKTIKLVFVASQLSTQK